LRPRKILGTGTAGNLPPSEQRRQNASGRNWQKRRAPANQPVRRKENGCQEIVPPVFHFTTKYAQETRNRRIINPTAGTFSECIQPPRTSPSRLSRRISESWRRTTESSHGVVASSKARRVSSSARSITRSRNNNSEYFSCARKFAGSMRRASSNASIES